MPPSGQTSAVFRPSRAIHRITICKVWIHRKKQFTGKTVQRIIFHYSNIFPSWFPFFSCALAKQIYVQQLSKHSNRLPGFPHFLHCSFSLMQVQVFNITKWHQKLNLHTCYGTFGVLQIIYCWVHHLLKTDNFTRGKEECIEKQEKPSIAYTLNWGDRRLLSPIAWSYWIRNNCTNGAYEGVTLFVF